MNRTALTLRGMTLDPHIPSRIKEVLWSLVVDLERGLPSPTLPIKGVRVENNAVVITVFNGNDDARLVCNEILRQHVDGGM
jgi:hypothetical protein